MPLETDTGFQIMASNCRFGSGITHEVGMDLVDLGAKREGVRDCIERRGRKRVDAGAIARGR